MRRLPVVSNSRSTDLGFLALFMLLVYVTGSVRGAITGMVCVGAGIAFENWRQTQHWQEQQKKKQAPIPPRPLRCPTVGRPRRNP